ncbi:MAG: biopolymer transporter ExbD [Limnohabitans sp.]|nr:MAG: biopolymer transporter ExbD [Limnohabitans sp.]
MSMRSSSASEDAIAEINVTPLVDVMLVLLIIFIVTAPMIVPQAMQIKLPQTVPVSQQDQGKNNILVVNKDGSINYKGSLVSEAELKAQMTLDAREPHYQLQVQADESVPYGRMAQIMALSQAAGLNKLTFVTTTKK